MENRAHALAAGLFIVLLGSALVAALWWFSDDRERTRDLLLVSRGSVTGLNPQAQVRYRGVPAGKVTDIRLDREDPRNILVEVQVRADLPLTRGTRASLGYQGVTGLAFVQLDDRGRDPAPLPTPDDGIPRLPLEPGLLDQITDTTMDALQRFRRIAEQIGDFFDETNIERFRATLERLESAAVGIDRTFDDAPATLDAIRAAFSPENVERLSVTLANLETLSTEAGPAVGELRTLLVRVQDIAARLDVAAGAAGGELMEETLPELNSLLKELASTSRRVGRLVEEVEASPQMLLTGRTRRTPGPGEAGFDRGDH